MIGHASRVRFTDRLVISIEDGPERHIPVRGFGFGTTIKSEPYLSPNLNLGPNFCKQPCVRVFRLTNMGRRHQNLVWIPELPPPPPSRRRKQMQQKDSNSSSLTKSRVSHVRAPVSTFKLGFDLKTVVILHRKKRRYRSYDNLKYSAFLLFALNLSQEIVLTSRCKAKLKSA